MFYLLYPPSSLVRRVCRQRGIVGKKSEEVHYGRICSSLFKPLEGSRRDETRSQNPKKTFVQINTNITNKKDTFVNIDE